MDGLFEVIVGAFLGFSLTIVFLSDNIDQGHVKRACGACESPGSMCGDYVCTTNREWK